jgi:hypothetical protein
VGKVPCCDRVMPAPLANAVATCLSVAFPPYERPDSQGTRQDRFVIAAKLRRLLAIRETSESHRSARSLSLPWTTQIDVRCGRTGLDLLYFSLLR